jgi:hypothetical protein
MDVESKLYGLTEETTECAKLRHKSGHAALCLMGSMARAAKAR